MARSTFSFEVLDGNKRYADGIAGLRIIGEKFGKSVDTAAPQIKRELRRYLKQLIKELRLRHSGPYPGGTGPRSLSVRSGKGMASLESFVTGHKLDSIKGHVKMIPYLMIHETGGIIRPKKARYLTIPLPAALNANGTPKKKSAREWKNTFVLKSKRGNLIIMQKFGGKLTPLYVLKKQVRIPPRLGLREAYRTTESAMIDRLINQLTREVTSSA